MTPWISARRADAFESKLSTPEAEHPLTDSDLLELVASLRTLEAPEPRPEFVGRLRAQLMAEAETALVPLERDRDLAAARLTLPERNPRRQRRLVAAIGAVVLVGTGSTMAVASQSALPGDGLYPIKRLMENARSSVTFDDTSKGEQDLAHARARLSEAEALVASAKDSSLAQVAGTLETFTNQARDGADLLLADFVASENEDAVRQVRSFAADGLNRLRALKPLTPDTAQAALQTAASALVTIDSSAAGLCPTCGSELADYTDLLAAPQPNLNVPTAEPSAAPQAGPALPTIDPDAVASANASPATPSATSRPSAPATKGPQTQPSAKDPKSTSSTAPAKPSPTSTPTQTPTPSSSQLLDSLLGDGSDGTAPGLVPGVVGGVVDLLDSLLGGSRSAP